LVTVNADGAFTYQHDGSENFSDAFTFEVTDAAGATSRSSVSITVNPVNDAPVAQSGTAIVDEGGTVSGRVTGIDPDAGDSLAYALVGDASHGSVMVNADGTFTYQHDGSENFTDAFTFEVTDATGATSRSSVSITVNPVNDAPVAQSGTAIMDEGGTVNGRVTGIDPDAGDSLTYALVGGASHGSVTVNADGTFSYEHDGSENFSDAFTFEVTDAAGATSRSSVSITVNPMNDAPVAQAGTATVAEGGTVTAHVTATDADVGDSLTYALIGGATHGSVTVNADGTFSYVHDGSENFTDTFTFQVTDTAGATSRSSVSITVNPVNDAPVAQSGSAAVDEGGTVTGRATATDADVGDTLTYALVGAASHGTATLNPDGIFTYRHDGTETTTDAFTFEVTDAAGATSQATVRITVTPVDDPTVARPDAVQVPEDTTAAGNVLANDSDPDTPLAVTGFRVAGDDTAYAAGASATVAGVGTLRIAADGSYTFTPQADWNGGVPQASYFTNTGATGDLSIVLTAVDDATITAPDAAVTKEGAAVAGNVLANDSDVDSALAIASFRIAGADYAAGTSVVLDGVGTLTLAADGSWFYTPVGDWNGAAPQVAYTTNTGATGVLAIGVTPVNDAPVRTGTLDGLALGEGESAALGFADVSYGPGGGADEAGQTLTVRVTDLPADLGTIVLADGTRVVAGASYTVPQLQGMVFQAAAGVSGSATFSFTVSDDGGGADTLAQQLTVSVANVAPVLDGANALPDLDEDATDNAGMLVGDLVAGHASDPAGNFGIAVVGAASSAGQWQFSRDGGAHWSTFQDVGTASSELLRSDAGTRIRFVPNADWNGTATGLAFRAWDGTGGTAGAIRADTGTNGGSAPFSAATATASITVHAVNDAPQALGPQATVVAIDTAQGEGTLDELAWTYSTGGGRDEAGQSLTVTITALPGSDIGQLVLADGTTSVVLGGHYTPDQLRGARLVVAEGSSGGTAELAWIVRDDGGTARGGVDQATGSVKLAVAPAPATTAPVAPAAPAPAAPQTAAPAPVAQATPAPAPTAPTAAPAVRPGDQAAAGDALVATAPPEALLPPPSGGLAVTPQRADDVRETARILGAGPNLSLDLSLLGVNGQGAAQFEITGLNGLQAGSGRVTLEQFQQSLRSGIFIDELNRLRDQLRQEFDLDKTLSVTVAGLSLGVSVVYVLWLVRGGVLLGSYLSALPAWRLLDPLPVLARAEGEDDEDDDEALDPDAAGRADPLRGFS
jgi:VCBS repeat-containing protein